MELSKVKSYDNNVSSNLDGESYKIEADAEFFNHLSKRIYTDSILAIVRELMCNAWDSQVEADNTETPIIVHCPNILEPVFKVIDRGVGMDLDTLKNVYSSYGKSTKRSNMNVTGGLGVGSKTPFAYTDSFTVYSVKDGMKHTMVNYKDNGMPKIKEIFSTPTDEPNGVEINVPVKTDHFESFKSRILAMTAIFHGNVDVKGIKQYDYNLSNIYQNSDLRTFFKVDDSIVDQNLFFVDSNIVSSFTSSNMLVLMGNVPYQVDLNKLNLESTLSNMIRKDLSIWRKVTCLEMPVGSLDFSMSREHLEYSDRTIQVLTSKFKEVYQKAKQIGSNLLTQCTDDYSRYQVGFKLHKQAPSIFEDPKHIRKHLITLNASRRGLETLVHGGFGNDVTSRKISRDYLHCGLNDYMFIIPDEGRYHIHVIMYENRNLKRKRLQKLHQSVSTLSVTPSSRRHASNSDNIIMMGDKRIGQQVVDIIKERVKEYGDNVAVHLHNLSDVEVEREPQEKRSKGMGKRINSQGNTYTVTIGDIENGLDKEDEYFVFINSEDREIDYSDSKLSRSLIDMLPKMMNDTTFSKTYTCPNTATVKPAQFTFMVVNKTTRNLTSRYENMIHIDDFFDEYKHELQQTIVDFIVKNTKSVIWKFASPQARTREKLTQGVSHSWHWDDMCEKITRYNEFSIRAFNLPLSSYSQIHKIIRKMRLDDKSERRKEVEHMKSTQYGRLKLTVELASEQLKMFTEFSKKRLGKYRYSKREK